MQDHRDHDSAHTVHTPVLLHEVVQALAPTRDSIVFDGTLGGGGHAQALGDCLGPESVYIGIDADEEALDRTCSTLTMPGKLLCVHDAHRHIGDILRREGYKKVDRILLDLGYSSDQLERGDRGFSFLRDEPLTMTFKATPSESDITAEVIVNEWDESTIADILYGYGEEKKSRRIARAIVAARSESPIKTSHELAELVLRTIGKTGKTHPATRTFQALRIAVNDELASLRETLEQVPQVLAEDGRIAVISFHSLEDRIVKHCMRDWSGRGIGTVIKPFPTVPTDEEQHDNPRARSAKLRTFHYSTPHEDSIQQSDTHPAS